MSLKEKINDDKISPTIFSSKKCRNGKLPYTKGVRDMKFLLFTVVMLVVFTSPLFPQSTTIRLPSNGNNSSFVVTDNAGNVLMKMVAYGEFYMLGNYTGAALPSLGTGPRLMWDPFNAAFRAGMVNGAQWDSTNTGLFSFATGNNTIASGGSSTAMGGSTTASGFGSTAMGASTTASGTDATAMGYQTTASGNYSTAMGFNATASGGNTIAMGDNVSTNNQPGSCIIADASTATITNSLANNQMTMRFAGGYRLFTDAAVSLGVSLGVGATSWTTISDSTKKERFAKVDGEYFLHSISQLRLGSWNYKKQDPQHYRHYGPMAQEIFHYFGKDTYGAIGNDTSLATADMDGIEMICLQALEKRTSELQKATANISDLEKTVSEQEKELASRDKDIEELKSDFIQLKKEIAAMNELKASPAHASLTTDDLSK